MALEESLNKPVVVVGIGEMEPEGTTMVAVRDCVPVVFASVVVCIRIDIKLIVVAGVDDAIAIQTRVVDAPRAVVDSPTAVVDAAFVAVHFVVVVVIVAIPVTKRCVGYYS